MSLGKVYSKMHWREQLWFLIHSSQAECQLITHPDAFWEGLSALCFPKHRMTATAPSPLKID